MFVPIVTNSARLAAQAAGLRLYAYIDEFNSTLYAEVEADELTRFCCFSLDGHAMHEPPISVYRWNSEYEGRPHHLLFVNTTNMGDGEGDLLIRKTFECVADNRVYYPVNTFIRRNPDNPLVKVIYNQYMPR